MKKIIVIFILLLFLVIFYFVFPVYKDYEYKKNMYKKINSNYEKIDIKYFNKYGEYYIIKDDKNIIVLDKKYKEVLKKELSSIHKMDLDIVYKYEDIMYEKTDRNKNGIIYTYYNIIDGKETDNDLIRR